MNNADVYTDLNSLQTIKHNKDRDQALRQVAQQFEGLFINMMLKSMRDANAVFEKDSLFNSGETSFYRDMYDHQLALTMAHGKRGGIGIADAMYRQLSSNHKPQSSSADVSPLSEVERFNGSNPYASVGIVHEKAAISNSTGTDSGDPNADTVSSPTGTRGALAETPEDFVRLMAPQVKTAAEALGVNPEFLIAQAALETGWGQAVIQTPAGSSFNVFNIKAGTGWQGDSVDVSTLEYRDGVFKPETARFRTYESLQQAVEDYVQFVSENPRYRAALEKAADGNAYLQELQSAGYATDPAYADKVLSVHNRVTTALARADFSDGANEREMR